jgi:hypothetical protein
MDLSGVRCRDKKTKWESFHGDSELINPAASWVVVRMCHKHAHGPVGDFSLNANGLRREK